MTLRMDHEPYGSGLRITSITSADRVIEVPSEISGMPVVSLGPRLLFGSPGVQGRTLRIPPSVTDIDSDALDGAAGLTRIEYGNDVAMFSSFGLTSPCDCTATFEDGFSFEFKGGAPMGFPAYDRAMLGFGTGLTLEDAVRRLNDPVCLAEDDREGYRRFVSERIVPRAERAVTSGDVKVVRELLSTGIIGDDDLRRLLERSARSGKVAVTSLLMAETSARRRSV